MKPMLKAGGSFLCTVAFTCVLLATACPQTGDEGSTTSSGGPSGAGCSRASDCPGGFACRARECVTSCPVSGAVTGCVVGAQCVAGQCVNNTACSTTQDCAFDKGEVCSFSTGTCVAAATRCTEGEMETLCANGFLCHVSVCYQDCEGSVGCPSGKTCVNHACL